MIKNEFKIRNAIIELVLNDITEMNTDAIVNAANSSLMGGGGVDGAIHKKGGSKILEECNKIRISKYPNGLPTGEAVITSGGNLKTKFVIHTVGPVWRGGFDGETQLLKKAYESSLRLAKRSGITSISFPSISTGAYHYPTKQASVIALKTIRDFLTKESKIIKVIMVLFSKKTFDIYLLSAQNLFKD
jgi:O-acetyl-ADP-ribose deacetylase (regulator of RNase III)